jgi:REP element-mobilizing transposase RayT
MQLLFITASTYQKQSLFQSNRMARLFLEVLLHYRQQHRYLLHEFVLMPDHFHLLITPTETLERALQLIRGGFSYRAKKELGFMREIWQPSYYDRRVRDLNEYGGFPRVHSSQSCKARIGGVGTRISLQFGSAGVCPGPFTSAAKADQCWGLNRSAGKRCATQKLSAFDMAEAIS